MPHTQDPADDARSASGGSSGVASDELCVARVPIFQPLSHDQQLDVASVARPVTVEKGDQIYAPGSREAQLMVVHTGQVHLYQRARLLDLDLAPGPETIENRLVRPDEIPWPQLAFRTVEWTLRRWLEDAARGVFEVHTGSIPPPVPAVG